MAAPAPVPPVSGEVQLDLSDVPRAVGWVQNDGHAALEDAVLIAERGFAPLGSLAPGIRWVGGEAAPRVEGKEKGGGSRAESDTLYIYELAAQGPPAGDRMNVPAALMRWQSLDPGAGAGPRPSGGN